MAVWNVASPDFLHLLVTHLYLEEAVTAGASPCFTGDRLVTGAKIERKWRDQRRNFRELGPALRRGTLLRLSKR